MTKLEVKTIYQPMSGYESKMLNRDSKTIPMGKVQLQSYPLVKNSSIVNGKYIMQMNYNGSMNQGGMKRGKDGIKNWPSTAVHYLMKKGYSFDTHGNCYLAKNKIVNKVDLMEVEKEYLQIMVNLQKYFG